MPCRATRDGRVIVESSDKTQSAEGENGNPLQNSCLENLIDSMKRQKGMTPEDEPIRSEEFQNITGEEQRAITNSFTGDSDGKESTCNAGNLDSILGLGRSPRGGHGNPLEHSCLENLMDRGAWKVTVHGLAKRCT